MQGQHMHVLREPVPHARGVERRELGDVGGRDVEREGSSCDGCMEDVMPVQGEGRLPGGRVI